MDLRKERTKQLLMKALAELLEEKDLNDITISNLIDTAGIARTTFYRNYNDKFDFLEKVKEDLLSGLFLTTGFKDKFHYLSDGSYFLQFFLYIKRNYIFFRAFYESGKWPEFKQDFYSQGIKAYTTIFNDFNYQGSISREILIHYIVAAHGGIFSYWIESGCRESAEFMAEQMSQLTIKGPLTVAGFTKVVDRLPK